VVMLLAIGGGAGYWYLQVQRQRVAEQIDLALMAAELARANALEAAAAAKAALSSAEAALNSPVVEAADTAKGAVGEAVAEKESGKRVEAGAGKEGKGEKSGTRGP